MSHFVFKHVYDLRGGGPRTTILKSVCFAIVTLPSNFCLDTLKGHVNTPTVVFLGQNGLLAEASELCSKVSTWLHITCHVHQS